MHSGNQKNKGEEPFFTNHGSSGEDIEVGALPPVKPFPPKRDDSGSPEQRQNSWQIPEGSLDVLVIGGNGTMGEFFVRKLHSSGHRVTHTDVSFQTVDNKVSVDSKILRKRTQAVFRKAQVIVIAVQSDKLEGGLSSLVGENLRGSSGKLLVIIDSTQFEVAKALSRVKGLTIVLAHPLFGGDIEDISGLNVSLWPLRIEGENFVVKKRREEWASWVKRFWTSHGALCHEIEPGLHDEVMSIQQVAVLLAVLVYTTTITQSRVNFSDIQRLETPNSRLLHALVARMVGRPSMIATYTSIMFKNMQGKLIAETFAKAAERILNTVAVNEQETFVEMLKNCPSSIPEKTQTEWHNTWKFIQNALTKKT